MIGLALTGLLGLGLFFCFLMIGVRGAPKSAPDPLAVTAVQKIVGMEGVSFAHFELLLEESDYKLLRSLPALRESARLFREDRGELAILWIGMLLNDLNNLFRFRRFLVQRGAPAGFAEEAEISFQFCVSVIFLHLLKYFIRFAGPFPLAKTARRAKRLVEIMSHAPARVLSRVPASVWPDIEQCWGSCRD